MTRCGSCGSENPEDFRFCGRCGAALETGGCPACGFENPEGQRFCGRCGTPLASHAQPARAAAGPGRVEERKLATVLFADVVGFTSLAETTDPETLARTVDAAFRRLGEIVLEHGGTIDKYMGDSLMAVFGVPVAHGDDAERAVAAALAMREETAGELQFSIGINSGEVMVAAVGRDGDVTVMGDTVNVAARLEKAAGAGEVLIGPLTAELVADRVVLHEREAAVLKGKRDPVPVWEAVSLRSATASGETSAAAPPLLLGRDGELAFLRSCWRRATAGRRAGLVLLTGDAGVGKTRLVDELVSGIAVEARVARATCPGYGSVVRARVTSELARQLGFPGRKPDETSGEGHEAAAPEVRTEEQRILAMRRFLAELSAERPILVVLDNCHHADSSDLEPLAQLIARLGDLPMLLLLVGRPDPPGWLNRFSAATTLHLDPLDAEDAADLAKALASDLRLADDTAELLAAQSGGNPLHLRELVRLLRSRGGFVAAGGEHRLGQRPMLPATLQAVLAARLDALGPAEKTALQDVALFSDGATIAEIAALGVEDTPATLSRLVDAGLLRHRDGGRYEVGDPLLREVAYDSLPRTVRGERHRQAASLAATRLGRARHLGLAAGFVPDDQRLRAEAADALAAAGLELIEASRIPEGIRLLGQAVELGHDHPGSLLRLAQSHIDIGDHNEGLAALDRIDPGDDAELAAEVVQARGNAMRSTELDQSVALLEEAAARWNALGNEGKRAWALANLGVTLFDLGRVNAAAHAQEEALEIFRELGDRAGAAAAGQSLALARPEDPRIPSWLDDGLRYAEETGDLTQERNALISLAWFRFLRSYFGGDAATEPALQHARRLARVCAELGDRVFEVHGHCICAYVLRHRGLLDEADQEVRRARRVAGAGHPYIEPLLDAATFMVALARDEPCTLPPYVPAKDPMVWASHSIMHIALLLAGRAEEVHERMDLDLAGQPLLVQLGGVVHGAALVMLGRHEEAVPLLQTGIDAATAMEATPSLVAGHALLAEVELRRGRREEAMARLESARDDPGGVAGVLLDRVRTLMGDELARRRLEAQTKALAVPGLLVDSAPTAAA